MRIIDEPMSWIIFVGIILGIIGVLVLGRILGG